MKHHAHERLRLPSWVRWWVYLVGLLCALSGGAWLLLHHFVRREGEFGPVPSVFEHPSLVVHGISGLLLLWTLGLVWLPHIRRGWGMRRHRWVGGTMAALMLWLSITAAGLYYLGGDEMRSLTSIAHWTLGLVAALWFPMHIWIGRRRVRNGSRDA